MWSFPPGRATWLAIHTVGDFQWPPVHLPAVRGVEGGLGPLKLGRKDQESPSSCYILRSHRLGVENGCRLEEGLAHVFLMTVLLGPWGNSHQLLSLPLQVPVASFPIPLLGFLRGILRSPARSAALLATVSAIHRA